MARPRVLLMFAICLQVVVFVVAQGDVPLSDPLAYADIAHWIATDPGEYFRDPPNHPFAMRVGITVPLAGIYRVFGVSQWTTNLPCLLAAIVVVLVVYAAAPTARAQRVGLGFASTSTMFVLYGTELNADLLCGATTATSLLLLSWRDRSPAWIAAAVVVWFLAFLVKETTIWFAPAWLYALVVDVRARGWSLTARRFAPALGLGLVLAIAYLWACAHVWGDPLARIHGINAIAGDHAWAPRDKPASWWLYRLTVGAPWMYLSTFGAAFVVALVAARRITGRHRIWVVASAAYLLMYWLGSGSSAEYLPMPLTHRRMLTAALPGVLVVATLASEALVWRRRWVVVVTLATVIPFVGVLAYAIWRPRPETALYAALRADAAQPGRVVVACPDFRCLAVIPFAFGHRVPATVQVVTVSDFVTAPPPADARVRIVIKPRARSNLYGGPAIVRPTEALGMPALSSHRNMRLYDAGDGARLHAALRAALAP